MRKNLILWCRDCQGATAIEYGLIAAGIALGITIAVFAVGDDLTNVFETISGYMP